MYETGHEVDKLLVSFAGILNWQTIQPFFDLVKNCSGVGKRWSVVGNR